MAANAANAQRLGRKELGRHAYEKQMPLRISSKLAAEDDKNKLHGIMPLLRRLLLTCNHIRAAYLCEETMLQIWKLDGEGNHFCAYRNAQMLIPSLQDKTVLQIQNLLEEAWKSGHNAAGRLETGGVAGTRKHIGTSEIEALLGYLNIQSEAHVFSGKSASQELLAWVEAYFSDDDASKAAERVISTRRPPLYLQMPFHSVTIVGCTRTRSRMQLLVLDPGLSPPSIFRDSGKAEGTPSAWQKYRSLWTYQRGELYLKRHQRFEVLQILPQGPEEA